MGTDIRTALERNVKAVALRPSVGQGTAVTRVRLREGLACDVNEGPWTLTAGMTEKYGGTNAGPNPGVLGRAALGSCLALGYGMWAARLGVPITSLDVTRSAAGNVTSPVPHAMSMTRSPGWRAAIWSRRCCAGFSWSAHECS